MRRLFAFSLILFSTTVLGQPPANIIPITEPPELSELPRPATDEETVETDITIIREDNKTIQEYRRNGTLYMVKIIPKIGAPYYLIDINGDGNMDVRRSDLDKDMHVNQWKILHW